MIGTTGAAGCAFASTVVTAGGWSAAGAVGFAVATRAGASAKFLSIDMTIIHQLELMLKLLNCICFNEASRSSSARVASAGDR